MDKNNIVRIGIVGSRRYSDKIKIKDFIFKLREKYEDNIEIVSGGCKFGADKFAKKFALEFGMKYIEFPPAHEPHNIYCIKEAFRYGKQYFVGNFFKRNKEIAEYSDKIIAFIPEGIVSNGTMSTVNCAKKMKKQVLIIT